MRIHLNRIPVPFDVVFPNGAYVLSVSPPPGLRPVDARAPGAASGRGRAAAPSGASPRQ